MGAGSYTGTSYTSHTVYYLVLASTATGQVLDDVHVSTDQRTQDYTVMTLTHICQVYSYYICLIYSYKCSTLHTITHVVWTHFITDPAVAIYT